MKRIYYLLALTFLFFASCEKEDELIDLNAEKQLPKVEVCHYDEYTDTWETITISENALKAHLAHGDLLGNCKDGNTYVPDDNFEQALIDLGYDDVLNDYVLTSNISDVLNLNVSGKVISDLTGIEDFTNLKYLNCNDNQLIAIDITKNIALTDLFCDYNLMTSIDVSHNILLRQFTCSYNQISSIDVSNNLELTYFNLRANLLKFLDVTKNHKLTTLGFVNNQLTSIDITQNLSLEQIGGSENQITSLDLSKHKSLIYVDFSRNQLTSFNMRNGNNSNITVFAVHVNPNLTCIQVDDASWSNLNWTFISPGMVFSENCGY